MTRLKSLSWRGGRRGSMPADNVIAGGGGPAEGVRPAWPVKKVARPVPPADGDVPEPQIPEPPFPMTGAHWLDGFVIFGDTYP
ncbi:hypothetical protein [Arthrobacter oryzae]|uniref:Uncharacterized protein n=1 Tax=Arthrobacter oryzae TaxID=409290 RepID=A0A495FMX8_9MICC|nr:hypothetical protein [Arthrobacter oryzae]RKR30091.1 hypothetical protein C8D78_0410 [Arthrobacter oryzae]